MVEELRVYCIRVIAKNVTEVTPLGQLSSRDLAEVCGDLSPDLALTLALSLPLTDLYWLRRARAHYPPPHVALQGMYAVRGEAGAWKTAYMKAYLSRALSSNPPPGQIREGGGGGRGGGVGGLKRHVSQVPLLLQLCGHELTSLTLPSLPQQARKSEGVTGDSATTSPDLPQLLHLLPRLQNLSLRYRDVSEGGFEGRGGGGGRGGESSAGATLQEVAALASALTTATPALTQLRISESCLDDIKVEQLVSGLRSHPALTSLDIRHNSLTSAAIPFLIDLMTSIPLKLLNLQHNDIGVKGTELLSVALARTPCLSLEALLMDLNPLGSAGGIAILKGAAEGGRRGGRGGGGRGEGEGGGESERECDGGVGGGRNGREEGGGGGDGREEEEEGREEGSGGEGRNGREEEEKDGGDGEKNGKEGGGDGGKNGKEEGGEKNGREAEGGRKNGKEEGGEKKGREEESGGKNGREAEDGGKNGREAEGGGGSGGGGCGLKLLSLSGCRLDDSCWPSITAALTHTTSLTYLSLAANVFKQDPPREVVESAKSSGARVLLSNLNGTTYFLGQVSRGRQLAPPFTGLQEHLARLPPLHDPLTQHLGPLPQLHGLHLHPKDFTLEEELRGMCLFTKNANTIINS
ncbi:hypothetical protein Pmani_024633 [Petrolisthes manimaculis]|uniref:Uncharacterized protein n=1 Tax=Petrolisthes manimaculis TaxID=1843537 RepID=A0AAE1TZ61_9EUCA|nr:hypothetical protein Pmani_024633 [Petrolisthes manimaculis]